LLLTVTLTCAPLHAFPQPKNRSAAVTGLKPSDAATRAEAVAWLAAHGSMADQPPLLARLRDGDPRVRAIAGQALWLLWSRSGDPDIDRLLAAGIEEMQSGRLEDAIASFSEVIRRKPAFAEGWNKRATAYYLAGDYRRSLADCDQVMKRNPYHFGALSGYGQIHFRLEQYDKAIAAWRRALEVNPDMEGLESNIEGAEQLLKEKRARSI
jgi:tetratricopeptide (TPR) repeat protein